MSRSALRQLSKSQLIAAARAMTVKKLTAERREAERGRDRGLRYALSALVGALVGMLVGFAVTGL